VEVVAVAVVTRAVRHLVVAAQAVARVSQEQQVQ